MAAIVSTAATLSACGSSRSRVMPAAAGPQPISMAALHQAGGVPPGWTFTPPPGNAAAGRQAFIDLGCYTCHAVYGEPLPPVSAGDQRPGFVAEDARKWALGRGVE